MLTSANTIVVYIFLFISLYFEVFLLLTYFSKRMEIKQENQILKKGTFKYPSVSILVPVWNEATTVSKTIHSLLDLHYPKDKLKILIIDDGSSDDTWQVIQTFANNPQIELHRKENGGKYTALNLGLSKIDSDMVGCLDADSYVDPDALKTIVAYFEDKETMAVTPSVKIWKPKNMIELIQKVEYGWGIFLRKMLAYMGALYVTPGPFSIFRKEVFQNLGGYRRAYLTEDLELALRMQTNRYKIAHAHNAFVYTVPPNTLHKLYKQRLRWTYGFLKNIVDYRFIFFKRQYGNLGVFILPVASLSIFSALYLVLMTVFHFLKSGYKYAIKIQTVGFHIQWHSLSFDWFSVNTQFVTIISLLAFACTLTMLLLSRKMSEGHMRIGRDVLYFMTLYTFIAPLWVGKALYNALFSIKTSWR
jgi:poly-beta-1,6-N-acetyl-D-glucosamine synthase